MGLGSEVGKASGRFVLRQTIYRFPWIEDWLVRCLQV
jgi:hypothetical protein